MGGLKIQNKPKNKTPNQKDFENAVQEAVENKIETDKNTKEKLIEFGTKLKKIFNDKTLLQNKNSIDIQNERKSLGAFLEAIKDIDLDENQDCNAGTYGAIALLINTLILQRDRINELEFKLLNKHE
jgi:H2-forming N5,N10-methylenetetrahydromethanopterin dehydrogenase-like enzyme